MTAKMETMVGRCQRLAEWKDLPTEHSHQRVFEPLPDAWPAEGTLRLENVEMRYQEGLPLALKGVSLDVRPGMKVGIVGRTGSGKSSTVLTCFRMVDVAGGAVYINNMNLATLPKSFRQRLGVMPQDSYLFTGTVRSNLDMRNQHTDEELWEAISQAKLDNVAKDWWLGLDHEVQEKGSNLSAGTCQLLCLARVLLQRSQPALTPAGPFPAHALCWHLVVAHRTFGGPGHAAVGGDLAVHDENARRFGCSVGACVEKGIDTGLVDAAAQLFPVIWVQVPLLPGAWSEAPEEHYVNTMPVMQQALLSMASSASAQCSFLCWVFPMFPSGTSRRTLSALILMVQVFST